MDRIRLIRSRVVRTVLTGGAEEAPSFPTRVRGRRNHGALTALALEGSSARVQGQPGWRRPRRGGSGFGQADIDNDVTFCFGEPLCMLTVSQANAHAKADAGFVLPLQSVVFGPDSFVVTLDEVALDQFILAAGGCGSAIRWFESASASIVSVSTGGLS